MIPAAVAAIAVGVMALAAPAFARDASPAPAAKVAQDERAFGQSSLVNINNMSYWFVRDGNSANNPANGNSGVTFPRSTDRGNCLLTATTTGSENILHEICNIRKRI